MTLYGLKTLQAEDFRKQQELINKLTMLYASEGFEPIEIPTIVDMSVASKVNTKFTADIFKLVDKDGTTLALRTEHTQPIAKSIAMKASRLQFPQKFFYNSKIFRFKGSATDASREIQQIGLEYFGADVNKSNLETVEILLKSASALDLQDYIISITDAKIWKAIFQNFGNPNLTFERELDDLIHSPNFRSKISSDSEFSLAAKIYKNLLDLNLVALKILLGNHPLKILLESDNLEDFEACLNIDLTEIKNLLKLTPRLVFDPLQCPDLKLYTGLHLMLFARGSGRLLALGGRYDKLCAQFGADIPAIGFAFYLPSLLAALQSRESQKVLRIALSKGSLLDGAVEFLASKKISIDLSNKRKLIIPANTKIKNANFESIEILLVRAHDVPIYVEHGAADLGILGLDTLIDSRANVVSLQDLNYGHCKLSLCAPKALYQDLQDLPDYVRVATTFPNISKDFFVSRGINAEIINLYGSVELGPLTNLSDLIVDLVASGKTLEENGLEVIETIMDCSAHLIANQASFKLFKKDFLKF